MCIFTLFYNDKGGMNIDLLGSYLSLTDSTCHSPEIYNVLIKVISKIIDGNLKKENEYIQEM